jgi:hypothetical protein
MSDADFSMTDLLALQLRQPTFFGISSIAQHMDCAPAPRNSPA